MTKGTVQLFPPHADKTTVIAATCELKSRRTALAGLSRIPPFSPMLNKLIATLSCGDVSFAKVSDLIEKDTVLAGRILSLVNSALFGQRGRVNSVRHAVVLLGVEKLRNVALGMSITKLWGNIRMPAGWSSANFNQHAMATALLSDMLSQDAPVVYPEGAFVAGLLHDIGQLLVAFSLPEEYAEIERICRDESGGSSNTDALTAEVEMRVLGFMHSDLTAEALGQWNLPEPIQDAVRYHLDPESDPSPVEPGKKPLSCLLAAANRYVNQCGASIRGGAPVACVEDETIFGPLHCGQDIPRILSEFHSEYESLRAIV